MNRFAYWLVVAAGVLTLGACATGETVSNGASTAQPAAVDAAAAERAKNEQLSNQVREAISLLDSGQADAARGLLATLVGSVPPPPPREMGAGPALGIADSVTIRQLADRCTGAEGFQQGFCDGYLLALLEFRAAYDNAYRTRQSYCLPNGLTTRDVRKVFLDNAGAKPSWRDHPALWGVSRTLNDSFPC